MAWWGEVEGSIEKNSRSNRQTKASAAATAAAQFCGVAACCRSQ